MANKILIVGLGNPDKKYLDTPHNAGFLLLDYLASAWNVSLVEKKFQGLWGQAEVNQAKVFLMKPLTYMNLSGQAVMPFMQFLELSSARIWVAHDEVDIELGLWNLKSGGGHRGHNGIRDIIAKTGSADFVRFRIGVGRPEHPDLAGYLLTRMSENLKQKMSGVFFEIQKKMEEMLL